MKAKVDQTICIGCGLCMSIEPQVFVRDNNGLAKALNIVSDNDNEKIIEAINSCPVSAISEE